MASLPTTAFSNLKQPTSGNLVLLCDEENNFSPSLGSKDIAALRSLLKLVKFTGKSMKCLELVKPRETGFSQVVVIGVGDAKKLSAHDWLKLGGKALKATNGFGKVVAMLDLPESDAETSVSGQNAADFALGVKLAAYKFDRYKSKTEKENSPLKLSVMTSKATAARRIWKQETGVADGVLLARDLVNEPANVLTPREFSKRATALGKLGIDVEILDERQMKKLGMRALLGVGEGSQFPSLMGVMQWQGGKKKDKPVAFVGKGVTFDNGGVSMKPPAGMEDMKGDMGGAAAVTGLMHALAARKAKVNAVGIIGLVENAVDGKAQRPGDIVRAMSGKTIEILNTDAEGRLVLADALWYCQDRFKPQIMIDLATLTGAILVSLGHHHAGLFSNDDELAANLFRAGQTTRERVWRFPLDEVYDKLLESKNADMKNIGGRMAGSITAAQFLQKFVNDVPWAHLDIAGTAMGSPQTEINKSWGSGFGVRLLDRLVRDHYEG